MRYKERLDARTRIYARVVQQIVPLTGWGQQFSEAIRPRTRGNFAGAWAKQNSRRLYLDNTVSHLLDLHVRCSMICLGARALPVILFPLRTLSGIVTSNLAYRWGVPMPALEAGLLFLLY